MNSWFYYELMVLLNVSISANIAQIILSLNIAGARVWG